MKPATHDDRQCYNRSARRLVRGVATSDGAGVNLTRLIGGRELGMLDPFLLLDHFDSDKPDDYIAGFPPHPHRGFETVTYMLAGRMRHRDNAGHEGVIESGGVQWMTAARGIIHSEMPEQEEGLMSGLQLWVNLPSHKKMAAPEYHEYNAEMIAVEHRDHACSIAVIAGRTSLGTMGPVTGRAVNPLYLDISLEGNGSFIEPIPISYNAFIYVLEGKITVLGERNEQDAVVEKGDLAILDHGHRVQIISEPPTARFILVAGEPLNESVARRGPFVMNTDAELRQAFKDYSKGEF
ncbi:pirin family protein [Gammaproteobacteria bacterium AH-315-C21]|nr:pirin family protein [Gammaproteobacteria bacterium AH-315-C21]